MRWLFLFVLSLNIAYIAWQVTVPEMERYDAAPEKMGAGSIVLLSELNAQADKAQADSVVNEDNTVAEDVVPVEGEAAAPQESAPAVAEISACYTLGPFSELETLRSYEVEIKPYIARSDFRELEEQVQSVYWVYIKPEVNRKAAIEMGRRLKAKKIKDFYIIREGEKNNGISLGHFKDKKRAYKLASRVEKLGFDVLIEPLFKSYAVYWLDYQLADDKVIPAAVDDRYLQPESEGGIGRVSRDCQR